MYFFHIFLLISFVYTAVILFDEIKLHIYSIQSKLKRQGGEPSRGEQSQIPTQNVEGEV